MAVYKSNKPTKDGRKYFFRIKYKDIFGEWHDYSSQKYKTSKEAKEEEAKYRIKITEHKTTTSNATIDDIFQEYILYKKDNVKKQTYLKEIDLYKHLEIIKNEKINNLDINKYKKFYNYLKNKDFSINHKNKILRLFKRIIAYSNKNYNTSNEILKFVETFKNVNEIKKEMDFFTYDEYRKFDDVINDFDYHTLFEILYFMGLRQGELLALTWKDIDFQNKTIHITKTLTTKIKDENWTVSAPKTSSSIGILPMSDNVYNDLKIMHRKAKRYSDYKNEWFVFGNVEPFKESTIQKKKNKYCKEADLKQIRVHDFRHSCASLLINKGASIVLVSKYLRHSNVSITLNTYAHLYQSELENMTKILNKL